MCCWDAYDISYKRPLLQDWETYPTYHAHRNKNCESGKMRGQRTRLQMKEQDKTPEEELSEVKISNLPNKEFKVIIINMLKELGRT